MTKPIPEPIRPDQLKELALAVVAADRFPYMATIDGDQPRLRPVSPVRTDGFTVYIANLRSYHKTSEIEANPKVELGYLDDHHDQVRITGVAEVVTDRALLQDIWDHNPLLRQYLGDLDNPELITPDDHVWTKQQLPWLRIEDKLPRFPTISSAVPSRAVEE